MPPDVLTSRRQRGSATEWAPLERPLQFFGTAVLDGLIYVVGGDFGGQGASAALQVFDPVANTWTQRASMPGGARWDVGAAALDGRLWVVGGRDASSALLSRLEVYDPATGRWATKAPMPTARGLAGGAAAIGDKLYVAGGSLGVDVLDSLEVYDPATDRWTSKTPVPRRLAAPAVAVDRRLFVVGGGAGDAPTAVFAYDPETDGWSEQPSLLWGRRSHGVAYDPVGRRLYAVCGYVESWLPYVEVCSPAAPPERVARPAAAPPPAGDRPRR